MGKNYLGTTYNYILPLFKEKNNYYYYKQHGPFNLSQVGSNQGHLKQLRENWLFVAAEETESLTNKLYTVKPVLHMYICHLLWSQRPKIFILRASRIFQRDTIKYKKIQRLSKRFKYPSYRAFPSKIRDFRESTEADPNHSGEVGGEDLCRLWFLRLLVTLYVRKNVTVALYLGKNVTLVQHKFLWYQFGNLQQI